MAAAAEAPHPLLADLEASVAEIRSNQISVNSRYSYSRSIIKFLQLLYVHKRHLLTAPFSAGIADSDLGPTDGYITGVFQPPVVVENAPIHFAELTTVDFMSWIVSLKKADGSNPGIASYKTHRSGLFHLYREFRVPMNPVMESELTSHFRGLKRKVATETADGEGLMSLGTVSLQAL